MLLQGHRPEWKLDDGSVDGLFVFSENALPCALEGLEEDELLRRDGGTKRVFIGVFVLLAPPPPLLVVAARRGARWVPLEGSLADLSPRGEREAGGGGGEGAWEPKNLERLSTDWYCRPL
jgi:hypothetical protein